MIFCYLLVRIECSKEEGKNHVCFTRIFEIERRREREKDGREGLLFQRLEKGRVRERGSEETSTRGKEGN